MPQSAQPPAVVVIGGPNGAGKSTAAPHLLQGVLKVGIYVDADSIARGLAAFDPESVAVAAGRIMRTRLHQLAAERKSFALETTYSGKSLAVWLGGLTESGYEVHLIYLWLPSPEVSIARVATRVQRGGHFVPDDVIRRRYHAGMRNFWDLYRHQASAWRVYDSSGTEGPRIVAAGTSDSLHVHDPAVWAQIPMEDQP